MFSNNSSFAATQDEMDKIENIGDTIMYLVPLSGLIASGFEKNNAGLKMWGKSFATNQVITAGLKVVTNKRRPNGSCCKSFPSGHSSASFMGASFIHQRYGVKYAIPAYIGATFVAYSRVYAKKHYVEDVVAGAALGVFTARYFTSKYQPIITRNKVGMQFSSAF